MADTTNQVIRLTEYDLLRTNKHPGNYYATTDGRKIYRDESESVRVLVDAVQIPNEKQRMYEDFPKAIGKLYFVWETGNLYVWNNRWELLKGNPNYPSAYQYIDGDIFDVGDMSDDVKGNGILGDGSVVIRDVNRLIKAKIYIDERNDNLVVSSYLGGGIKILPNGNMENTGALYLNPTTIGRDIDGLGQHFCEFENINGEIYIKYDDEHEDPSRYKNSSHRYMVWHEGNLDGSALINEIFLLKDVDEEINGNTHIENTKDTKGLSLKSTNNDLDADIRFETHHDNLDKSPILGELVGEDIRRPLTNNEGLYIIKRDNGNIEIHLRKNKSKPITEDDLSDNDTLINKGEIIDLMNQTVYSAMLTSYNNYEERYTINDDKLIDKIKEGLVISVNFNITSNTENVYLRIGTANNRPYDLVDLNLDPNIKKRPIGFIKNNIYQLIRSQEKWIVINAEMRAKIDDNGYGLVRVTGDSSDAISFTVVTEDNINLNDPKYLADGTYSFILELADTSAGFPEEENKYISDTNSEYILQTISSCGRGYSTSIEDNYVEQVLTNVGSGRKYRRYVNRTWVVRDSYETGELDSDGRDKTNNLRVRQKGRIKADPNSEYRFEFLNITPLIQFATARLTKDGCSSISSFASVNNVTSITTNANTKYLRTIFRYQDNTTQLAPSLIRDAIIKVTQVGFSRWIEFYNDNELCDRERISSEDIILKVADWKLTNGMYVQTFYRNDVSERTLVEGNMDADNQGKIETSYVESFNYGFRIWSISKPTKDITITMIYTETKGV